MTKIAPRVLRFLLPISLVHTAYAGCCGGPHKSPDVNGDGVVDTYDLGLMLYGFGMEDREWIVLCDLNGDGKVNTADLGILLNHFGE